MSSGFKHGKDAEIWLGGMDVSSFFNDLGFAADVDTAEASTFKRQWKRNLEGLAAASVDLGGVWDPSFGDFRDLIGLDAGAVLTIGPGGMTAVSDLARLILPLSTSYKESSKVGDVVAFSTSVVADGDVGFGVVLHPLVAVTADGSGTTHVGPVGGTANGAIAHLHVTDVSAGDDVTVSLEDSANGSDWAPIAGGAFANLDAIGAERLVIPGTIRRYTRAAWDVSGASVSIIFGVALARL